MTKKLFSLGLCISLVLLTLCGCDSTPAESNVQNDTATESEDTTPTITEDTQEDDTEIALTEVILNEVAHSIFYAPLYVAIENGYFEEEGISLELVTGFGADNTTAALIANEADIGFMGPETTIYTYQEGSNDLIVNFAQLTQRAGNFVVARDDIEDFQWEDMIGTTVLGGRLSGMPEMVFEYILKQNGIDPTTDLTIIDNIDFGSTAAAYAGGQGDYTVEFEPSATALEQEGDYYVVASLGIDSGYVPYTAFCAKTSYMEENPEIIQGFTNAIQKGINFCNSATAEEIALIISPQFSDTDLDTITTIVARYDEQDTWKDTLVFEEESFELLQDILDSAGQLTERVSYNDLVTTSFAEEAALNVE